MKVCKHYYNVCHLLIRNINEYFSNNSSQFFLVLNAFSLYQSGDNILAFLNLLEDELLSNLATKLPKQVNQPSCFTGLVAFNIKIEEALKQQKVSEKNQKGLLYSISSLANTYCRETK